MTAYLVEHPPVRSQYRKPRRDAASGVIVLHTAENAPDFVAFDGGAEAVARFIQSRTTPGSYHELVDKDSAILVVPYEWEAYHDGTGTNRHSLSISVATRADVWPLAPQKWRDGAVENAAKAAQRQARWVKAKTGITIPARRITADEAHNRVPGFVSHAQLDPTRRTDPGKDFPWSTFLARYAELSGSTATPTEDDDMPLTKEDKDWIRTELTRHAGKLTDVEPGDATALRSDVWRWTKETVLGIRALLKDATGDEVDEAEVAAIVLAGLDPAAIAAAIPADIAEKVADELAERLGG